MCVAMTPRTRPSSPSWSEWRRRLGRRTRCTQLWGGRAVSPASACSTPRAAPASAQPWKRFCRRMLPVHVLGLPIIHCSCWRCPAEFVGGGRGCAASSAALGGVHGREAHRDVCPRPADAIEIPTASCRRAVQRKSPGRRPDLRRCLARYLN